MTASRRTIPSATQHRVAMLLATLSTLYRRGRTFLGRDIWLLDVSAMSLARGLVVRQLQVLFIVLRGFFLEHQCLLRASALTFTTLLALVPMLAFTFAFLKGLGVQNQLLEPLLVPVLDRLAVGAEDTVELIIDYINNVKVGTLGAIGLGSLLFSTLLQLGAVEQSFNTIWGLHQGRTPLRKITDYVSVMVIAPLMLLLAIAATAALKNQTFITALLDMPVVGEALVFAFTILPYVAIWIGFTFFYTFIPNTRVKLIPAFAGGIIAGTLWQLAQKAYIAFLVNMPSYQAIYGAFAQFPVLIIWLYISWVILLLGAEIVFACQHADTYAYERLTSYTSIYRREWLASAMYFSLIQAFKTGQGPWSAVRFANHHRIPVRLVRDILDTFKDAKLLVEDAAMPEHYLPRCDPDAMTPWHVLYTLRHHGNRALDEALKRPDTAANALLTRIEEAVQQVAESQSFGQWLAEQQPVDAPSERPLPAAPSVHTS
ncbi:hypothetical protein NKDENANG_00047 [Candidatus Entotheonellaceae bacterium PAL068K]